MKSLKRISILLIFIIGGCNAENNRPGEFNTVTAIVQGSVMSDDEKPIEGATITVFHRPNGCEGDNSEPASVSTNGNGEFDIKFLIAGGRSDMSCYVVKVIPADTNKFGLPEVKEISPEFRTQSPFDTVTVDFELSSKMR